MQRQSETKKRGEMEAEMDWLLAMNILAMMA